MIDGINVIEFDLAYANADGHLKRSITFLKFAWRSVILALTERYDVLFASTTPLTAAIPGIAVRWIRGSRFVFEVRDLWPELPKAMGTIRNPMVLGLMGALEWLAYKSAHRLIGLSPGIVEGIVRHNIPPERVAMIPNGCDLKIFAEPQAEKWRPEGVSPDDLMAVFTGTHGQANGLDAVLDTAHELKRRGRADIKLVLVGQGKLKQHLVNRATLEKLNNVIFHDPVPKERLAGLMAEADIGLQILENVPAFYYGTSPNKFFDYIASGLPVLINYPGWITDKINEYSCGYAVSPEDPVGFADALLHAANHRDELLEMGQRALSMASTEFSRSDLALQFTHVLETAAKR